MRIKKSNQQIINSRNSVSLLLVGDYFAKFKILQLIIIWRSWEFKNIKQRIIKEILQLISDFKAKMCLKFSILLTIIFVIATGDLMEGIKEMGGLIGPLSFRPKKCY
jgi:hypothetical protein